METLTADGWAQGIVARRPLATDDFHAGMRRLDRAEALKRRHIGYNSDALVSALVLDVDHEHAEHHVKGLAWDAEAIPDPSWVTINPVSGHAHVGYLIGEPVTRTDAGRRHPLEYAASIERTLTERLGADRAYRNVVTRNPLHASHGRWWGSGPYTLGELHESLGELSKRTPEVREAGLGRNVDLFDSTRAYAYRAFKRHDRYEPFRVAVELHAVAMNGEMFDAPLSGAEVAGVARSVSAWVWRTFTRNEQQGLFSEIQRRRSMRQDLVVQKQQRVQAIRETAERGNRLGVQQVMSLFEVSERTARDYLREAGLTIAPDTVAKRGREALALRARGMSLSETAKQMDLSVSQVRHALRKAQA